jgi:hypothetical protein
MSNKIKNIKYLLVLFILSLLFVSCEKQPQKEWTKLYGYTAEEIAGTYAFSNISDAFESLTENAYCHVCEDAKIDITAGSANTIEFHVNCPSDEFNRTFEGRPRATDDDYLINLTYPAISSHPSYELTAYVYKNHQGDIRIHGFARHVIYETVYNPSTEQNDYVPKSNINYWFDVIKN